MIRARSGATRLRTFFFFFTFLRCISGDSRCFLVNGGSSVSFFVSEDVPIGFNLGVLEIQGDPRRDIELRLRETGTAPVRIEPHTKNITLTRKLDKEGVDGPSTVSFTVLCDKRHNNEPSIAIPVTIRVSDVNDNRPTWLDGPFSINVSEQTLPGSTIMTGLKAIDMDQHGTPYSTLTFLALDSHGRPSNLVAFAGGGFEGRLILSKPLDYESMSKFGVTLRVSDHGTPPLYSDTQLDVSVIDSDDLNPRFEYVSYSALLPTNPKSGTILEIEPGPIRAMDQDTGINAPLRLTLPEGRPEAAYFRLDSQNGRIMLTRDIPEDQLNQPITLVLKAEQLDNPDRYAISTLHVGKKGSHTAPLHFVQTEFQISVPENAPVGTILFTALTSRPADRNLKFVLLGDGLNGLDLFQVGTMGQLFLRKSLDYETQQKHALRIFVTDGFQNATTTVLIQVLNVNDWSPRFRQGFYEFNVSMDLMGRGGPVGQIEVADGDLDDRISLEIKNTNLIRIDGNGRLYVRNKTLVKREMMFLVVAKDTGEPPREAFVPVVIRLNNFIPEGSSLETDFDSIKIALVSALALVAFAIAVGIILYFGYCRKRRKIQSENFQKRIFERNINNPLALHKLVQPGSLRRSNKVRSMSITSPILVNAPPGFTNGLTPLDPLGTHQYQSGEPGGGRPKSVTWSPKVIQKQKVTPIIRAGVNGGGVRLTTLTPTSGPASTLSNGYEIDPDTSVTPLETYSLSPSHQSTSTGRKTDTLQSTSSLTLYF